MCRISARPSKASYAFYQTHMPSIYTVQPYLRETLANDYWWQRGANSSYTKHILYPRTLCVCVFACCDMQHCGFMMFYCWYAGRKSGWTMYNAGRCPTVRRQIELWNSRTRAAIGECIINLSILSHLHIYKRGRRPNFYTQSPFIDDVILLCAHVSSDGQSDLDLNAMLNSFGSTFIINILTCNAPQIKMSIFICLFRVMHIIWLYINLDLTWFRNKCS